MFIGPDTFTELDGRQRVQHFDQDSWMVKSCFGDQSLEWDQNKTMYNAGVWGGRADVVRCLLVCVSQLLGGPLRGKGNCNMPALNWCISHGPCSVDPAIDPTAAPPPASSMSPPSIATTLGSTTCLPPCFTHLSYHHSTFILIITTTHQNF